MAKVLVIDDEPGICQAFSKLLRGLGHTPLVAPSAEQGIPLARRESPDLVLLDIRLPGMDGLAALESLKKEGFAAPVVILTAHGTLDTAVRALKLGAYEYLTKPIDLATAEGVVSRAIEKASLSREVARLQREIAGRDVPGRRLVGTTPAMQEIFKTIAAVCGSDVSVLIQGESGTGKELVAREIHAHSPRAAGPFEAVNCAAIPASLLESELYGHEKGAFTGAVRRQIGRFERAHNGTIFLDEIGEIPPATQVKLLRVLEERAFERVGGDARVEVNLRILAATNQDLEAKIARGEFREDLYYRLKVVTIDLPPLRERASDIPLLVARFLAEGPGPTREISEEALGLLTRHRWPGNVRELRNAIEHASVLARGAPIRPEHLPETVRHPERAPAAGLRPSVKAEVDRLVGLLLEQPEAKPGDLFDFVERQWESALLRRVLDRTDGNQVKASDLLGIHRTTLRTKLQEYGLLPRD